MNPMSKLVALLRASGAELHEGVYVYSIVPVGMDLNRINALAIFKESEGVTVVVCEREAEKARLPVLFRVAWITLKELPDSNIGGLIQGLKELGLSCNIVAAVYHHHLFVPVNVASEAFARLRSAEATGCR